MDRLIARILTVVIVLWAGGTAAQSYDQIVWKEVTLETGVTVLLSASDIRPTARLTRISEKIFNGNNVDITEFYETLFNLGLKYRSAIGLQDLKDGNVLVWGTGMTLSGRQKFMARYGSSGLLLFTSSIRDFIPSDAKAFFDVKDLHVTGSFDERLEGANINLNRDLTQPYKVNATTNAAPVVAERSWPKPLNIMEKDASRRLRQAFPDALAPPPMLYTQPDGKKFPALYRFGDDGFFAAGTARFGYFQTDLSAEGDVRAEFGRVLKEKGIKPSLRASTLEAPEWRRMHGARYWAEYGDASFDGVQMRYFIELYDRTIIVFMAPHQVFASWGGPIAPLAYNGYIRDPENLDREARLRMQALTAEESVRTHVMIVEKKMQNATFAFAATMNTGLMMWLQQGLAQSFNGE